MQYDLSKSYRDGGAPPEPLGDFWTWLSSPGVKTPDASAVLSVSQSTSHLSCLGLQELQKPVEHAQWTYGQLIHAAENLASFLFQQGIRPGDVLTTFLGNSADWALFFWVSARLGTTFAPLDASSLNRPDDVKYFISVLAPKVVVVQDTASAYLYDSSKASGKVKIISQHDSKNPAPWISVATMAASETYAVPLPPSDRHHCTMILFTSGSTSSPKACPLSTGFIMTEIFQYHMFYRSEWDSNTRFIVATACFKAIAYLGSLNTWQKAGCVIFRPFPWKADADFLRDLTFLQCTHTWANASQLNSLASSPALQNYQPSTLKLVQTSGEKTHMDTMIDVRKGLRSDHTIAHWGMTEGAPLFGWIDDHDIPITDGNIVGIGKAMPGTRVKVCSEDSHTPMSIGERGELHVSSPAVIKEYIGGRGVEDFYRDDTDLWFKTGDLVSMNQEGVIFIVGRIKDIIKTKAIAIVPSLIEDVIKTVTGLDSQVVGIPDVALSERPVAILKDSGNGIDFKAKIQAAVGRKYGEAYAPVDFVTLQELSFDSWPINPSGKIMRRALVEKVEEVLSTRM